MAIKTIIIDMGGTLFADGGKRIGPMAAAEKGYDPELIKQEIVRSPIRYEAMRGRISDKEFWNHVKISLPAEYDIDYLEQAFYKAYADIHQEVLEVVKKLKAQNYRLIIWSGNMRDRVAYIENKFHFLQYFDQTVFSFDFGASKPEPLFTDALVSNLECLPEEAVLIDDSASTIAEVKAQGIHTIQYKEGDYEYLCAELAKLGVSL